MRASASSRQASELQDSGFAALFGFQRGTPDAPITQTMVMHDDVVRVGDRVKHYAERHTGFATATVVGFYDDAPSGNWSAASWVKVLVRHDHPDGHFGSRGAREGWDWDRTELAVDREQFLAER